MTKGAVTQQVNNFERALGVALLERDGRRMRLTEAGAAVLTACASAARELEAIDEIARLHRTMDMGTLRVGAAPTCASYHLPPVLARFTSRFPRVEVAVSVANSPTIAAQVASGELDCGFIEGAAENPRLDERLLVEDELIVVAASDHPLARGQQLSTDDLGRYRYLSREPGSALETSAREMLAGAYDLSPHLQLAHLDAVRAAAVQGLGYAILPIEAVERELQDKRLRRLPLPSKRRWIRVVRRASSRIPAVDAFWRLLPPIAT